MGTENDILLQKPVKVDKAAQEEGKVINLKEYFTQLSNDSIKGLKLVYAKDAAFSSKNKIESIGRIHANSIETKERAAALAENMAKTAENLKLVMEGLEQVKKA